MSRGAVAIDEAATGFDVLRGLCRDLSSAYDRDEAAAAAAAWIRASIGADAAVTVTQPDRAGRLRVSWRDGGRLETWRQRSVRRRAVFEAKTPARLRLSGPPARTLAMFPLVYREASVGVLEVAASDGLIEAAWETIDTIGGHLAVAIQNLSRHAELEREVESLRQVSSLSSDLVRAGTPEAAIRVAVGFVSGLGRVPVAGWREDGCGLTTLTCVAGLGMRRRRELRQAMASLLPWGSMTKAERREIERRFGGIVGVHGVSALEVDGAVLLAGSTRSDVRTSLDVIGSLLASVLRLLSTASLAQQRTEQLDMGIAWTAHELRAPLLGLRAVLELLLLRGAEPRELEILRRSLRELDQLVGTSETLLAWASGARPLQLRRTDLVRLVEEAVESCRLETGESAVVVLAPDRAVAWIDPLPVRAAIANLLRNAVAFADEGTKVEVTVEDEGDRLMVSVKDEGPEIPAAERRAIFDPFVRGRVSGRTRNGSGLGLFIARRVVEAHRGRIWVDSDQGGTTFHVLLPIEGSEQRRFAS